MAISAFSFRISLEPLLIDKKFAVGIFENGFPKKKLTRENSKMSVKTFALRSFI